MAIRFFDMFAGIGGFRSGLHAVGGFQCIGHCEIDKYANQAYKGKFLLSYNDCPEIRELYNGFSLFDFSRIHSMAQRYEAGKEFKELLIGNYDLYEREKKNLNS